MAQELKIKYIVDKVEMSDEEYENQEEKVFILTEDMIIELMEKEGCLGTTQTEDNAARIILKLISYIFEKRR